jgi:hypothetical protein
VFKISSFFGHAGLHPISHQALENNKIPRFFVFRGYIRTPPPPPFLGRLALVLGVATQKAKKGGMLLFPALGGIMFSK